ncbi:MAG: FAD-dependent oxidoreductase [Planctomycetota bacterium]|nr:FAD-dependent oxidoreductase [Planctomycetota bacterium]
MNRRELLAAFLGAPFALSSGCGMSTPGLPSAGGFVGSSHRVGHKLRDGFRPTVAQDDWTPIDVVIVGGGVAGLSAARKLKQAGVDFVLLELEPEVGGTAISGESSVVAYPWAAHYLPVPLPHNTELIDLLDEMKLLEGRADDGSPIVAEQFLCRDPQERLFIDGKWQEGLFPWEQATDEDLAQLKEFEAEIRRWVAWKDAAGRRAFTIPVAECSNDREVMSLDSQSMLRWFTDHDWTSPRLRWYVDYACRDDYGLTIDQTSAWAGVFYFAARVREAGGESQSFITWPEGNGRLVAHLSEAVSDGILTGHAVSQIVPGQRDANADSAASRTEVTAFQTSGSAVPELRGWRARQVIFAAPPFLTPHLVESYRESITSSIDDFTFGSWLVANLHLDGRPADNGFPMSWDNVIYDSPSLGYVTATHQRGIDRGPTVLTYYYPLCDDSPKAARERLLSLSWEEWADVVLSDLDRVHPDIRALTKRLDIMRWGHAMIRPTPGFFSGTARTDRTRPFRNIHFAHSALSGVPLFEEAFYHGNRAATEILELLHV